MKYVRSVTGTEAKTRNLIRKEAHRKGDIRKWGTTNLRCTSCRGECGICNAACCIYENAKRTVAKAGLDSDRVAYGQASKAQQLIKIIESLGPQAKDVSTFSMCSPPGGCGRYVCLNCCGVCPKQICRDIQCKVSLSITPASVKLCL